ncbi:MAG TPA: ribosome-binding factor A [Candidatus Paceibacterota bacterium]|jgi:ribosome-binding factor A|nr:ribosome-binding factor A [Candidatus Paceibacterota bacterium]
MSEATTFGRDEKIKEQIKEIAAHFIERETNKTALITVTRVDLFEKGRKATVYITVLPESGEESALNFLKRKRSDMKDEIKKGLRIRTIPFLDVEIDKGEKARRHIDELLKE